MNANLSDETQAPASLLKADEQGEALCHSYEELERALQHGFPVELSTLNQFCQVVGWVPVREINRNFAPERYRIQGVVGYKYVSPAEQPADNILTTERRDGAMVCHQRETPRSAPIHAQCDPLGDVTPAKSVESHSAIPLAKVRAVPFAQSSNAISPGVAVLKSPSSGAIPKADHPQHRCSALIHGDARELSPLAHAVNQFNQVFGYDLRLPMFRGDVLVCADLAALRGRADVAAALRIALQESEGAL